MMSYHWIVRSLSGSSKLIAGRLILLPKGITCWGNKEQKNEATKNQESLEL